MASEFAEMLETIYFTICIAGGLLGGAIVWFCYLWYFHYRRKARREIKIIAAAIRGYIDEYNQLPVIDSRQDEQPAARLLEVLCGRSCLAATSENMPSERVLTLNPKGIDFIKQITRKSPVGYLLSRDPWETEYHIAIGRAGDGMTTIGFEDHQIFTFLSPIQVLTRSKRRVTITVQAPLAVWSNGPNRKNEGGYGDDICSWWSKPGLSLWSLLLWPSGSD